MTKATISDQDMKFKPWVTSSRSKWDARFFKLAEHYSTWSKDPSTGCGAVITRGNRQISHGYNGFPAGTSDDPSVYTNRDTKLLRIIHAELNAILHSKQDLSGCTIYVYPLTPCASCMAAIIQSGIIRVVTKEPTAELKERWLLSNTEALHMAKEAKVSVNYIGE